MSHVGSNCGWDGCGRSGGERDSLDVDILLYDEEQIDEPELVVPHPRMAQRAFVLLPLLELDPDPVLPDGTRLKEVRLDTGGVTPSAPPLAVRR